MPYDIVESHPKCNSDEVALVQSDTQEFYGCHSSRSSARDQITAIETNKFMASQDIIVTPAINVIKDIDDKGGYGGYLINFGSVKEHDLERDFFNKETDFWLDITGKKSAVLYGHGKDEHFGKNRLDKGGATLTVKDAGIWLETQLRKRNEYEEMVQKLAKEGKLGLSSGTAQHLVEREVAGESNGKTITHIKQWPVGFDATLTPTPAEPRLKVQPLDETEQKSIKTVAEEVLGSSANGKEDNIQVRLPIKASQEAIEERYKKFRNTVNMSASEIEKWGETECSDKASNKPKTVRNRVTKLLKKDKDDWGDKEYEDAGRVISFISRMRGAEDGEKVSDDCPSKRNISLRNWGYDPTKALGDTLDGLIGMFKSEHSYSSGDLVSWEGGSAQGKIVRQVGPNDTVSPSTTDREFSGEEDDPGYLIEIVDKDDNGNVVGRDETVFHLESTLSKITESDVKTVREKVLKSDMKGVSLKQKRSIIKGDFRSQFRDNGNGMQDRPRVREVYDSYVIVKMNGKYWRVPYSGSTDKGYEFKKRSEWTEVVRDSRYIARDTAKEVTEILDSMLKKFEDRNGTSDEDSDSKLSEINNQLDSIIESIN